MSSCVNVFNELLSLTFKVWGNRRGYSYKGYDGEEFRDGGHDEEITW